jgi:hypothetical protein
MTGLSRIVLISAGACLVAACASSEPEPNTQFQAGQQVQQQPYPQQQYPQQQPGAQQQYPQQQYPQQQYPQQQQPAPQQQPGALPAGFPTALPPLALPIPNAPVGSPATPLDAAMGAAAQPILNSLANTSAPGAKPLVGNFAPGQQLETLVTMQPGKCYTVIAAGLPPVAEVNVQLVATTPIPGMNPVLAQDQTTGAQAVLGQAPNCFKWALPLAGQVKVFTSVAVGQGVVAIQVYEK